MLRSYLPVLVFAGLGVLVGGLLAAVNGLIGPRKPMKAKSDPYECGLPSEVSRTFRFGVCLLYTSPSPRDGLLSRMPSSA